MSTPGMPPPAKPVISLILAHEDLVGPVVRRLEEYLGPLDLLSPSWPFTETAYYNREMGEGLTRRFASFLHLADPAFLGEWKLFTNGVEARFTLGGRRLVNLDPGYLTRERLVLATGKNYAHRLYLGRGIYGDLTLLYRRGGFEALDWSYPDYARGPIPSLLTRIRRKYLWQLKELGGG